MYLKHIYVYIVLTFRRIHYHYLKMKIYMCIYIHIYKYIYLPTECREYRHAPPSGFMSFKYVTITQFLSFVRQITYQTFQRAIYIYICIFLVALGFDLRDSLL
jgi:hypothetical protein